MSRKSQKLLIVLLKIQNIQCIFGDVFSLPLAFSQPMPCRERAKWVYVVIFWYRVAEVGGPQDRRSPKGQGLLQKKGPPTYAILSQNLVLSQLTHFLKSHPAFVELSTKVILLFVTKICNYALYESSEGLFCGHRKPASPCHPVLATHTRTSSKQCNVLPSLDTFH